MTDASVKKVDYRDIRFAKKELGSGTYGRVHLARWRDREIAVKELYPRKDQQALAREINQLSRVQHKNIVKLYGISNDDNKVYLLMEFMEGGSLHDFLYVSHIPYQYHNALDWAHQIAQGLAYLHEPSNGPIVHRDIKPLNILLSKQRSTVKIGDFGNAKTLETKMTSGSGTAIYMAPEVFSSGKYTVQCDVYSFAITVWEMLAMQQPLKQFPTQFRVFCGVKNGERPSFGGPMKSCPTSMQELIVSCWDKDPTKRPLMKDVVKQLREMQDYAGVH